MARDPKPAGAGAAQLKTIGDRELALAASAALSLGQLDRAAQLALQLGGPMLETGLREYLLGSIEARRGNHEAALQTAMVLYEQDLSRDNGERLRRDVLELMRSHGVLDPVLAADAHLAGPALPIDPLEPFQSVLELASLPASSEWLDLFRHWSACIGSGRLHLLGDLGSARLERVLGADGTGASGLRAAQAAMGYDEVSAFSLCYYLMGMRGVESLPAPTGVIPPGDPRSPQVSVILPAYNKWLLSLNCLRGLVAARHGRPGEEICFEVILADDASTDDTPLIAERCGWLVHARAETNGGFVDNCNQAAARARGEVLLFLNNDTLVGDGWLGALLGTLSRRPGVGVVGSQVYGSDGGLLESGGIVWGNGDVWNHGRGFARERWFELDHEREVDYVSGCALAIRRELWEQLGGFDASFRPAYCEDADLCLRSRHVAGRAVAVQPQSRILHLEGLSNARTSDSGLKRYQTANLEKLRLRWRRQLLTEQPIDMSLHLQASDHGLRRGPVALVVDHYFPTPDKDAGSRCTLSLVASLLALGFKVVFLPENFAPMEGYRQRLEAWGVLCLWGDEVSLNWAPWLAKQVQRLDLILYNRPHITSRFLPELTRLYPGAFRLYNTHDLHGLRKRLEARQPGQLERELRPPPPAPGDLEMLCTEEERRILQSVDAVLSISAKETALLRPLLRAPVHTVPGYVIRWNGERADRQEAQRAVLLVGGFGHRPNQLAVRWLVEHVWPLLGEQVTLVVVGSGCPEDLQALLEATPAVRFEGAVSDERLAQLYGATRLSLAPLPYGAGLKGKVIEALSWGHRVLGTGFAFEGLDQLPLLAPPEAVRPCHSPEEYVEAILEGVAISPQDAELLDRACRQFIEERFSAAAQQEALRAILAKGSGPGSGPTSRQPQGLPWPEAVRGSAREAFILLPGSTGLCADGWLEADNQLLLQPRQPRAVGPGGEEPELQLGLYLPESGEVKGRAEVEIELGDGQQPPWRGVLQLRPELNRVKLPWPAPLAGGLHLRVKAAYRYVPEGGADQRKLLAVLAGFDLN
jgi:GT2 family glycosyltransferase